MSDKFTKKQRSYCMSQIRGKNTKPELIVRRFLFSKKYRFHVNFKKLPGSPDIVLPKYRTTIFINGCFWHGHENCKHFKLPQTRTDWWKSKINRNIERDRTVQIKLRQMGWHVMIVWECQLKPQIRKQTLEEVHYLLNKSFLDDRRIKINPNISTE